MIVADMLMRVLLCGCSEAEAIGSRVPWMMYDGTAMGCDVLCSVIFSFSGIFVCLMMSVTYFS